MKTPLGTEVDLGPGHIVLDWDPAPPRERGSAAPVFSALWPRSAISATAELLLSLLHDNLGSFNSVHFAKSEIFII